MKKLYFFFLLFVVNLCFSQQIWNGQISESSDDAEENSTGTFVTTTSSDLELVYDTWNAQGLQLVGLRFQNVNIPKEAVITDVRIQFTATGSSSGNVSLTLKGEKSANAPAFPNGTVSANNLANRPKTNASVTWNNIGNWSNNSAGNSQKTPNLTPIVQEIMSQTDWVYGNPLVFYINGNGSSSVLRRAFSYDGTPSKAAKISITYTTNFAKDLSVTSVQEPSSNAYYTQSAIPASINVKNLGSEAVSNFQVAMLVNGEVVQTKEITSNIIPEGTETINFETPLTFSTTGEKIIEYKIILEGDQLPQNNIVTKKIKVFEETENLFFSQGSSWKYFDSPEGPSGNWMFHDYDDSAWKIGYGKMGFGINSIDTPLTPGSVSYYFRKDLNVSDLGQPQKIFLHLKHNDAAIVYVNGTEVLRTELIPYGNIQHNTPARATLNPDLSDEFITYTIEKNLFNNGTNNTIAIVVKNYSASNSTVSFDAHMTENHTFSKDGPYVFHTGIGIFVGEVTQNGLVVQEYGNDDEVIITCNLPDWDNKSFSFPLRKNHPIEPSEFPDTPTKFLVISDFDNHIKALSMVLIGEGIMDENFNWTYGNGNLVISGDLFDRGVNVSECLWLLYKLDHEAAAQGGKLHFIIGNHEMMNLTDDWRYITGKYFTSAHLFGLNMIHLYGPYSEFGRWLRSKNIILKLGNNAIMHAGMSPEVAELGLSYQQMNDYGRAVMNFETCDENCQKVTGSNGVYWYRGFANQTVSETALDQILSSLNASRIIIGHTKGNTVRSLYNGKVLAIDMYHIDNYENGFMEALQFELGCFRIFHTSGSGTEYYPLNVCDSPSLKTQEELVSILKIYPNPAKDFVNIQLPEMFKGDTQFYIADASGKLISHGKITERIAKISVQNFTKGVYFLTVKNNSYTLQGKLMVK